MINPKNPLLCGQQIISHTLFCFTFITLVGNIELQIKELVMGPIPTIVELAKALNPSQQQKVYKNSSNSDTRQCRFKVLLKTLAYTLLIVIWKEKDFRPAPSGERTARGHKKSKW